MNLILKIKLLGVDEVVERLITVPRNFTFKNLHTALQTAMGWKDIKDYYFILGNKVISEMDFGIEDLEFEYSDQIIIGDVKEKSFQYFYDGENWIHEITVEGESSHQEYPQVLEYKGDCPMEEYGAEIYNEMIKEKTGIIPKYDKEEVNHILEISFK